MTTYKAATTFVLTAGAAAALAAAAAPASAGGIGDILSPAFGTNCANHNTGPHAAGTTTTPVIPTCNQLTSQPAKNVSARSAFMTPLTPSARNR
ncbi:hypothetical protein [Streptomyces sp. NPDC058622]|uniref:hypothetical protein n=1 Tax=Streptomyces sp. NPDC058622 TaxID=3346562 RepID=UPI00364A47A9